MIIFPYINFQKGQFYKKASCFVEDPYSYCQFYINLRLIIGWFYIHDITFIGRKLWPLWLFQSIMTWHHVRFKHPKMASCRLQMCRLRVFHLFHTYIPYMRWHYIHISSHIIYIYRYCITGIYIYMFIIIFIHISSYMCHLYIYIYTHYIYIYILPSGYLT